MKTTPPIESNTPEPPIVHDVPATSMPPGSRRAAGTTARHAGRRTPLARLLAALRGDKYMVDAYPVEPPPMDGEAVR